MNEILCILSLSTHFHFDVWFLWGRRSVIFTWNSLEQTLFFIPWNFDLLFGIEDVLKEYLPHTHAQNDSDADIAAHGHDQEHNQQFDQVVKDKKNSSASSALVLNVVANERKTWRDESHHKTEQYSYWQLEICFACPPLLKWGYDWKMKLTS